MAPDDPLEARAAAAVLRLVARGGLEAVSMRTVAAEADASLGALQRAFGTKEELLLAALRRAYVRMEGRIERRAAALGTGDEALLVAVLHELLGVEPETRDAIRINVAFAARGLDDERISAALTEGDEEILALGVAVVTRARDDGRLPPDVDPALEARGLFALATGLGGDVALYGASPELARATLEHHLRRVLGPRPA